MGNQSAKQATRYRNRTLEPRKNFSVDYTLKNQQDRNSLIIDSKPPSSQRDRKKSSNVTPYDDSILRYLGEQQKQPKQIKVKNNARFESLGSQFMTLDNSSNIHSPAVNVSSVVNKRAPVEKDRVLANLSRKNEELRKQLKEINEKLTEKLKRKKMVPKVKKQEQEQEQNTQQKKQQQTKAAGLRRQLQNGYRQVDMYKRTLQQLNARQEVKITHTKVKQMQNQVSDLDRIINQTMKKIDGMKNIKKHQEKKLEHDINQDLVDNLELLKKEEEQVKNKIKELNKRDTLRENNYKKQQAYLFQVEKKYREVSGQYFPQLKKKNTQQVSTSSKEANSNGNKKPSTFDKYSNPTKKGSSSIEDDNPSPFEIKTTTTELTELKAKHEEYHRKIDSQLQTKNKATEEIGKLDQQIAVKDKLIESLKLKLVQIRKIIRPNKKALFGYDSYEGSDLQSEYGGAQQAEKQMEEQHQQDQFDIKHLIANIPKPIRLKPVEMEINNSIRSGISGNKSASDAGKGMVVTGEKSQPKVWGTSLTRKEEKGKFFKNELSFDDSVQFENSEAQPLIIGINGWVNKNGDVLALQAIYLNGGEIRYGVKSSIAADGFIVRYDLQAPDYLKNITGGFNENGVLEYIAFFSKKGKSGTFGNKRENQQSFTFGLASSERPFRFSGATIMIQSEPRICRVGIEICNQ